MAVISIGIACDHAGFDYKEKLYIIVKLLLTKNKNQGLFNKKIRRITDRHPSPIMSTLIGLRAEFWACGGCLR